MGEVKCSFCKKVFLRPMKRIYEAEENGRIPMKREYKHDIVARKRFGSWNKAIIAAGFRPNPVRFVEKHIANDGHK